MKEKKARVEDAMHATKAAVEEGIVPGGGVALLRAALVLKDLQLTGDEQIGVNIITRAVEEPLRWIATNAGHEGSIVVQRVKTMKHNEGFNAQTEQYRTWSRPVSSIRPKWCAPRSRTPPRSRRCSSQRKPSSRRFQSSTRTAQRRQAAWAAACIDPERV